MPHAGTSDGAENNETDCYNELPDVEETCALIDSVAENLKQRLREQPLDRQLLFSSQKFVRRYQAHKSNPLLASALHRFGWVFGCSITSKRFGNLQHGKRITVQATAAGRRRKGAKKGKGPIIPGRPAGNGTDKHSMSVRNEPKGKCIHSLAKNITKGTQNAGKWFIIDTTIGHSTAVDLSSQDCGNALPNQFLQPCQLFRQLFSRDCHVM